MKLQLKSPTNPYYLNQGFLENGNTYYSEQGLLGHPALDLACGYRQNITASIDSEVYSILNKDNPDLMKYRAVYTVFKVDGIWYELCYGHLIDILVKKGDTITIGQIIGTGGNTGDVSSGGKKVTAEEKNAGSHAGVHLHWQLRSLILIDWDGKGTFYGSTGKVPLYDGISFIMRDGKYLAIDNYYDGKSGCIDPTPYLDLTVTPLEKPKHTFTQKMVWGDKGEEVMWLQKVLVYEKLLDHKYVTGNFLDKTMRGVMAFQEKYKDQILKPLGMSQPSGKVLLYTLKQLNLLYS